MKNEIKQNIFSKLIKIERAAFIVDQSKFENNLDLLKSEFQNYYPKIEIGYSYKTNYIPNICRAAHEKGCWAEVVSEMEVEMAMIHLIDKSKIIYNGPIKTIDSIQKVIEAGGIINIDNLLDLQLIEEISKKSNSTYNKVNIALRLNFEYDGHESRFGIEINKVEEFIELIERNPTLELIGYHLHLPFRSLESYQFRIESFIEVLRIHGTRTLKYINIGGGFFGKISPELARSLAITNVPDFKAYGKLIGDKFSDFFIKSGRLDWPDLFIEPGSSVVADCLWFLSRIHTMKKIGKKNILVTYAGRHLLSPTNKTIQFPVELYQTLNSELNNLNDDLFVVGYTCIESDILGLVNCKDISKEYDFIAIGNVGSYSIVMGSDFILPQPAIYIYNNKELKLIRPRKSTFNILNDFI